MELRRCFWAPLLLVTAAVLLLLFVLGYANSENAYQQASASQIVKLIDQGEVKVAPITYKNQTIQITTKSGKNLEASWSSGQGRQLQNELQQQYDKGNLPDGYSVNIPMNNTLLGLLPAVIYIVSFLLISFIMSLYLFTAGPFRGGQPAAIGLPHAFGIAHGASCRQSSTLRLKIFRFRVCLPSTPSRQPSNLGDAGSHSVKPVLGQLTSPRGCSSAALQN